MKEGPNIYVWLATADHPETAIQELRNRELRTLRKFAATMPDTGFPGVIKAMLTNEEARRWRDKHQPDEASGLPGGDELTATAQD
jgi:hypothetical protein